MSVDTPDIAEKKIKTPRDWSWVNTASAIMFSFVAGLDVDRGIIDLRTGKSDYNWICQLLTGLGFLLLAITSVMQRKVKKAETPILAPQADSNLR